VPPPLPLTQRNHCNSQIRLYQHCAYKSSFGGSRMPPPKNGFTTLPWSLSPPSHDPLAEPARKSFLLHSDAPLFKVAVHQAEDSKGRTDLVGTHYIVSKLLKSAYLYPTGRGMRGYLAFDCQSREKVFLKDAWRIRACGQEGVVYAMLRECQVEHISPVVAHGDVPGKWQSCGRDAKLYAPGSTFCEDIHYRIVLKIVGKTLSSFSSTHELVTTICDALIGPSSVAVCHGLYSF